MKTINFQQLVCVLIAFFAFACKKVETQYVPVNQIITGTLQFNGDTTVVNAGNITLSYYSSSPCFPSNEVFFFKVSATNMPSNATYNWDFGDGQTATGTSVQNKYAYGYVYTVTLTVKSGANIIQEVTTAVSPFGQYVSPTVSFYTQLNNPADPNWVAFNSQSNVTSGSIAKYDWDWNDGKKSSVSTSYTEHYFPQIPADKFYAVKLTVTTHAGCSRDSIGQVFVPAKYNLGCGFTTTKTDQCFPSNEVITFIADTAGVPAGVKYEWDFSDGIISDSTYYKYQHQYTYSRNNAVILRIKLNGKTVCNSVHNVFSWGQTVTPHAFISDWHPTNPPDSTMWFFNASGSQVGNGLIIDNYAWDFGDNITDTRNSPTTQHFYFKQTTNRSYNVKLTVTATSGCKDSTYRTLTVPK